MLNPKFIIDKSGELIIGKVKYHKDLDKSKIGVVGGGWFKVDAEEKKLYLYSESNEFGSVEPEQIIESLSKNKLIRLKGYRAMFSTITHLFTNIDDLKEESIGLLTIK